MKENFAYIFIANCKILNINQTYICRDVKILK